MAVDLVLGLADRAYEQGDWVSALSFYRNALAMDPAQSAVRGYRLTIGHCQIELAAADALAGLALETDARCGSERERILGARLRVRARDLCRAGDGARAARLLRLLAACDPAVAETYAQAIDATPAGGTSIDDAGGEPPFLASLRGLDVAALKQRLRGLRVLLVFRRGFYDVPARQHEPPDVFARSAVRFGLTVETVDAAPPGRPAAEQPTQLHEAIAAFHPDVIVYDGLFASGASATDEALAAQFTAVLAVARRYRGCKVVNWMPEAWRLGERQLFRGLDVAVDLVQHHHPAILGRGGAAEAAATFCYVPPLELPVPRVEAGTIPQACFVGTITEASIARLVWWAESAARGLPLAFLETEPTQPTVRDDGDFADLHRAHQLSVNFTRRAGAGPILTPRTVQTLLAGGVLLEERSVDSAYFLTPGRHYVAFTSLADLTAAIDHLLRAPARRAELAAAGQGWAQRYFTGDYFWAGLLGRVIGSAR